MTRTSLPSSRTPAHRGRSQTDRKLHLENLERRDVPAVFSPLATTPDGAPGSLRDAVIQANGNGQDNVINLSAGTYQLTLTNLSGQENAAKTGDLDLTEAGHSITIQGAGAGQTIVDGGNHDRVFQVMGNVTAILRGLSLRNGLAQDDGSPGIPLAAPDAEGGAILNAGNLTLDGVVVELSTAAASSGTNGISAQDGSPGKAAFGAGIADFGSLTVSQSIIRNNTAVGGRGGMGSDGTIFTRFSGGAGGNARGGGIWTSASATLTVDQSTLSGNKAFAGSGGVGGDNAKSVGGIGGDGGNAEGGGLYLGAGTNLVVSSTISDNSAAGGFGGSGGGGGNSSSSGMTGQGADGGTGGSGGFGFGGGIAATAGLTLSQATVAVNATGGGLAGTGGVPGTGTTLGTQGANGSAGAAAGGGLELISGSKVNSVSTIIGEDLADASQADVVGAFGSASFTLLQSGSGAGGITNGVSGNIVGKDPLLGLLQDNGGPTPTRLPLASSPAIDAGSNPQNLLTDQRGFTRIAGKAIDIGAVETGSSAPLGRQLRRRWRPLPRRDHRRSRHRQAPPRGPRLRRRHGCPEVCLIPLRQGLPRQAPGLGPRRQRRRCPRRDRPPRPPEEDSQHPRPQRQGRLDAVGQAGLSQDSAGSWERIRSHDPARPARRSPESCRRGRDRPTA